MTDDNGWLEKKRQVERDYEWYRSLLNEECPKQLSDLPLMDADTLDVYYYRQTPPDEPGMTVYRTSGTSSKGRKAIVYSEEDERYYIALKQRLFARIIGGDKLERAVSDMGTGHAAGTAGEIFAGLGMDYRIVPFEQPIERHVEVLRDYRPGLLYTMPSILERLVQASDDPKSYGIRQIILVGEPAGAAWIANMAAALGIGSEKITDTYGSIELGTMAVFSHEHGKYLLVEDMIAEALQPHEAGLDIDPFRDDEAILVLTCLHRRRFPALRFVTYDVVRGFRPAGTDGLTTASFESIVKRVGPEFKHGEKISFYDIEEVVNTRLPDAIIRADVTDNRLTVTIASQRLTPEMMDEIRKAIGVQIPEIGLMIRGGLLDDIRVVAGTLSEMTERKGVKHKKLHIHGSNP